MILEEEIKQTKFMSPVHKAVLNILFTSNWISSLTTKKLKPFGISPQQYNVLRILRGSAPQKMILSDISSRMIDKMSNATRLVEKLKQKSLCTRELNEENRRQVLIGITEKGLQLLTKVEIEMQQQYVDFNQKLSEQEAEILNQLLEKLRI
jgi:DNA-binding MarR family transcriptional regulator